MRRLPDSRQNHRPPTTDHRLRVNRRKPWSGGLVVLWSLIELAGAFTPSGWAASTLAFNWQFQETAPPVLVVDIRSREEVLLRLRAEKREWIQTWAQRVVERLDTLAQASVTGADWTITPQPDGPRLEARGQPLLTITEAQSQWSQIPAESLAQTWLKKLQTTFNQPYLSLPQREISVPEEETVQVPVGGTARGKLAAELGGTGCSRVIVKDHLSSSAGGEGLEEGSFLVVKGLKQGQEGLLLRRGNVSLRVLIVVRVWAGRIRQPVTATVTGQSPPPPHH